MPRSATRRQNESARTYLDLSGPSAGLQTSVEMVARALDFPMALVAILDESTQYIMEEYGFDQKSAAVMPRIEGMCDRVVRTNLPILLGDTHAADVDNDDLVTTLDGGGISSFSAVPLRGREGIAVGALCLLDFEPHTISDQQFSMLERIASVIENLLDQQRDRGRVDTLQPEKHHLSAAIDSGEIIPFYQPIVDFGSGKIKAFEALARWAHPARGILAPDTFIHTAEESDLIIDLDLAILAAALADMAVWLEERPELQISVNVSGQHFSHPNCIEQLTGTVLQTGISPQSVILELTETYALSNTPVNRDFVTELQKRGFQVALDDVGAGWSSLNRLANLPVNGMKIDRAITSRLGTRSGDALVAGLATIADSLDLFLVIEGIETTVAAELAVALGCTHGQGYLWSPPVPETKATELLLQR